MLTPSPTCRYIADVVHSPSTFEQLRTTSAGDALRTLTDHLSHNVTNPAIVNALLYVLLLNSMPSLLNPTVMC